MGENLSALLFIAIGAVLLFSQESNGEKYKIKADGKPVDVKIAGKTYNIFRLIIIFVGTCLVLNGIYLLMT